MPDRVDAYASAIFEVAKAEGSLDEVADELFRFTRIFESNDELRNALTDQALPPEKRQAIVEDLLGGRALPLTTSLISFVVAAGRGRDLPKIVDQLVERAAAEREHVVAEVRAAVELTPEQRQRLEQALSTNLKKDVEVKVIVDPSVLGGVVARVGDTVIDGSIRHRLDQLKESL
ncbi:MAG: synthase, delta subunit [Acidimicrobiales bacterium]|nr:synthase, delta subunit [Acidimicrobiales bacterium]